MELQAKAKTRIAFLNVEMDELHRANGLYWKQGQSQSLAEKSKYEFRNERLEEIRNELARLRSELQLFEV